jgi:cytosine/adenosine deaminase-related metal-dependent hydrolase
VLQGFGADDEPIVASDAGVLVDGGMVASVGPFDALRAAHPDATVSGGPDYVVIPGFVNAHHHIGLTPLQLGSPDHPLELWFASRLALRDVDLYLDTLYSAFEMIASGVTTVQHLHGWPRAPSPEAVIAGSREVMRAYRELGMRCSYSMALRDQNHLAYEANRDFAARLPGELRPGIEAYFARVAVQLEDQVAVFHELYHDHADDPLIRVQLAPANLHWLSDRGLEVAAELAEGTGAPMHMHLLETPYQKAYALRRTGGSALAYLQRFGLTGPRLTIGHGVWLTDADIDLCAETGTRVCHNCSSNFRLKSGVAPINRLRAKGIPVAIGLDEAGINDDRDMLQELRLVLRTHREPGIEAPHPIPAGVLRMATEHGAGTTSFADSIGKLEPGRAADLVILDWNEITYPYQSRDIPWVDVLVQRARPPAVNTVMIGGEVVYRDGRFTRVDRDAVLAEIADMLARPLTPEEDERRVLAAGVMEHFRRFYDGYLDGIPVQPHYRPSSRI